MFFYDYTYILVVIGGVLCMLASANVNGTYRRYMDVGNSRGLRAENVAQMILSNAGIFDVRIERIQGNLTDHYSPREKVLRLSDSVYGSPSVAAIGVAAHECGHAIQHHKGYMPITIRNAIVPVANFGSNAAWPVLLFGAVTNSGILVNIGIILFSFAVLFQLVTLPVEFNASGRALKILKEQNILQGRELSGAGKVLRAAAMTYVASMVAILLQLLRLLLIFGRRSRDN
ncbi:MAG TPA: peptidase [Lachnospiraceae bacterium]|nr:peptidase [Lachnospiraceae bacterium]